MSRNLKWHLNSILKPDTCDHAMSGDLKGHLNNILKLRYKLFYGKQWVIITNGNLKGHLNNIKG